MKKGKRPVRDVYSQDDITTVASATECTGLMYKPADDYDEWESYHDLHGLMTPDEHYED